MRQTMYKKSETADMSLAPYWRDLIYRMVPETEPGVSGLLSLVVFASERGHVCLPLFDGRSLRALYEETGWSDTALEKMLECRLPVICERLLATPFVGRAESATPFVIDLDRLYLQRYWRYEWTLAESFLSRVRKTVTTSMPAEIKAIMARLFPAGEGDLAQKRACLTAFCHRFCVICGGPGTGKTTVVAKIMALLLWAHSVEAGPLRIALAAPTGKAAARLQDSLRVRKAALDLPPEVRDGMPDTVQTLHRLLGTRTKGTTFRHHKGNPLEFDVLVVDEASMVDLALMAKLFSAVPEDCRVLLLGDKDQLTSVEAGRVLGDLSEKAAGGVSPSWQETLAAYDCLGLPMSSDEDAIVTGDWSLADVVVELQTSYRFSAESGIGRLARSLNSGDTARVRALLTASDTELDWQKNAHQQLLRGLINESVAHFDRLREIANPEAAFEHFDVFRVICAHRRGIRGAEGINRAVEEAIVHKYGYMGVGEWYLGRPIMITENDYQQRLFNGDIGITLYDSAGELKVFFLDGEKGVRSVPTAVLPAYETAYALTVHKSQGSEFDHVVLVLPEEPSPVLSRELLYTAVTRARKRFSLLGNEKVLEYGVGRSVSRSSGLAARL